MEAGEFCFLEMGSYYAVSAGLDHLGSIHLLSALSTGTQERDSTLMRGPSESVMGSLGNELRPGLGCLLWA